MSSESHELSQVLIDRRRKLEELRAAGIEPFPHAYSGVRPIAAVKAPHEDLPAGEETDVRARIAGRLAARRGQGKAAFLDVVDRSGRMQLHARADVLGEARMAALLALDLGDLIGADGNVFRTRRGELSIALEDFALLAKSLRPPPDKHHGLADVETRHRHRELDLMASEETRAVFVTRAKVISAIRRFLDDTGFVEVETPMLQPLYGGAAARPFVTHHNQLEQDMYLRISFELYLKRLLVGNFEKVYEIGRDFRNEGVSFKHNPEFTQLEFYWAYADYLQVMALTEQMVSFTAQEVLGTQKIVYKGNEIDLTPPWKRLEMRVGILETSGIDVAEHKTAESLRVAIHAKHPNKIPDPKATRGKLIDFLLSEFLEPTLIQPTFLYNYPRDISPLAKSIPGDPLTVERFEAYAAGFELCNAFTELNDPLDQEQRFVEMGRDYAADDEEKHPMDEDYLRAMRYGMPPNGGFGMGVDRLVMLLLDKHSIREVLLFPALRNEE